MLAFTNWVVAVLPAPNRSIGPAQEIFLDLKPRSTTETETPRQANKFPTFLKHFTTANLKHRMKSSRKPTTLQRGTVSTRRLQACSVQTRLNGLLSAVLA